MSRATPNLKLLNNRIRSLILIKHRLVEFFQNLKIIKITLQLIKYLKHLTIKYSIEPYQNIFSRLKLLTN